MSAKAASGKGAESSSEDLGVPRAPPCRLGRASSWEKLSWGSSLCWSSQTPWPEHCSNNGKTRGQKADPVEFIWGLKSLASPAKKVRKDNVSIIATINNLVPWPMNTGGMF